MHFLDIAFNHSNLQTVVVDDYYGTFLGLLEDGWHPCGWNLHIFELNISHYLNPIVPWMISYLHGLTHLHISVRVTEAEGLLVPSRLHGLHLMWPGSGDVGAHLLRMPFHPTCLASRQFSLAHSESGSGTGPRHHQLVDIQEEYFGQSKEKKPRLNIHDHLMDHLERTKC
ncbi:hypothetical protein SEVIR_5G045425v4 [Setaria viridis]